MTEGESYVVQMIRASNRAKAVVAEMIGAIDETTQVKLLRDQYSSSTSAISASDRITFREVANTIQEAFLHRPLPEFTVEHLQALGDKENWVYLKYILNLKRSARLLDNLFDPGKMLGTLSNYNTKFSKEPLDVEGLLLICLQYSDDILVKSGGFTWEMLLKEDRWLRYTAIESLQEYAGLLNWEIHEPIRILAAVLNDKDDKRQKGGRSEDDNILDAVSLTYIRQRFYFIVSDLEEQALQLAKEAAAKAPSISDIASLQPWIELYERGAVARALPYLYRNARPLSKWLVLSNVELSDEREVVADEETKFVIRNNRLVRIQQGERRKRPFFSFFKNNKNNDDERVGYLEVFCKSGGKESAKPILICRNLNLEVYELLIRVIPNLSTGELSPIGDTMGERLLNTTVSVNQEMKMWYKAAEKLDVLLVQSLVLFGVELPFSIEAPWKDYLNDKLPYKGFPDTEIEVIFGQNTKSILNKLQIEYQSKNRRVKVNPEPL